MNEDQTRKRLEEIVSEWNKKGINPQGKFVGVSRNEDLVRKEMDIIRTASGGEWNDQIAREHISSFEADHDLSRTGYSAPER